VTADLYGKVKGALARKGTPIPQNGIWIAAVVLEHNVFLATRDGHFSKVTNLVKSPFFLDSTGAEGFLNSITKAVVYALVRRKQPRFQ
jgi:hypothetical protein